MMQGDDGARGLTGVMYKVCKSSASISVGCHFKTLILKRGKGVSRRQQQGWRERGGGRTDLGIEQGL